MANDIGVRKIVIAATWPGERLIGDHCLQYDFAAAP
jgi:hypothetical protein